MKEVNPLRRNESLRALDGRPIRCASSETGHVEQGRKLFTEFDEFSVTVEMGNYFHRFVVIILFLLVGTGIAGIGEADAARGGSFDVPRINGDFNGEPATQNAEEENGIWDWINSAWEWLFGESEAEPIPYNREKALEYARQWSDPYNPGKVNPDFERFDKYGRNLGGDCANFVSQMLLAGGLEMNDDWYYHKEKKDSFINKIPGLRNYFGYFSPEWAVADNQYRYFSNLDNGYAEKTYEVATLEDLEKVENSGEVQPGDLLYWDFEGDGEVDHATMITNIDSGRLYYSGHTLDQYNADVYDSLDDLINRDKTPKLHIVKMKDQVEGK